MSINQKRYLLIKRTLDIVLSTLALCVLSPLFLVVSIAIKIDSPGPILFKQRRVGLNESYFYILKFRSMRTDAPNDSPTDQLEEPYVWLTKIGKIIRKTSIDELPQLINILRGEMSIVGPRPALWNQENLIKLRKEYGVHLIKPGLTGWAQVHGRDENNDEEKVYWDYQYLKQFCFSLDLKCTILTITTVFNSKGVVEGGKKNGS